MDKKKDFHLTAVTAAVAGVGPDIRLISIIGGVWTCAPVTDSPSVVLTRWRVYEVKLPQSAERTQHFAGYNTETKRGRVSSAVEYVDPGTRRGVTESRRIYELQGPPGPELGWGDADYVWMRWKKFNNAADVVDVTDAVLK